MSLRILLVLALAGAAFSQLPHPLPNGGYALPNGWRITPVGKSVQTEDLLLNLSLAPDGKALVGLHSGFNPHGLVVVDTATEKIAQRIPLKSSWLGLAWSPDGKRLFVSGGNANGRKPTKPPIYVFGYAAGKLTTEPVSVLNETLAGPAIYWSAVAHHPKKPVLYAANRGTVGGQPGSVVIFDTASGKLQKRIPVEVSPYDVLLSDDARTLYVSNWSSDSISVIDTESEKVVATIPVGDNPNDLEMSKEGLLYVSCANDNSVVVVDTKARAAVEKIVVSLTPRAPEGTTPNALTLDRANGMLFVANGDNNAVAVVHVGAARKSEVLGFIPSGWYPSALALGKGRLYVGNSKGHGGYSNIRGPHSPLPPGDEGNGSVKSLQKGTIQFVPLAGMKAGLAAWTKQVLANVPYKDEYLTRAKAPTGATVIPREVGAGSPIKHIIYVIKENRTYDQVFGDIPKGNGDPRITIFGEKVTPNQHAIAQQWVLLDNLYCDGEVSVDGHSWSNGAYATDFNEKLWPPQYGGHSNRAESSLAAVPASGFMWDMARRKGLTYRSYGEAATRSSDQTRMEAIPGLGALVGHVAPKFKMPGMRDTDNVREFIKEFDEYEKNFESTDPEKRLPNYIVMSLPENHTNGTRPGAFTPKAMVANNDYAVGQLVERVTHSRYWPETAIFIIEDDAQDGSDHVDARRTIGTVISPYVKRGIVDSTLYTTSSFLRTMELLLGLPPMSQYDAAATPLYASFGDKPDLTPFKAIPPQIDVNEKNLETAWGAKESMEMDFSDVDLTPMFALNEIIWKSVKGADSPMPLPVHRFWFR